MAFDSIDKIFNDMLKRYNKLFGHDMFDAFPDSINADVDDDAGEFEQEKEIDISRKNRDPRMKTRNFGYEIISGSDMKEPVVRIYGNPDEFPELKERLERFLKNSLGSFLDKQGLPMRSVEPDELEAPAIDAPGNAIKEPFSESFNEKDGSTIVNVDLPGVKDPDVSVKVDGKKLHVEAHGDNRHYKKTIELEKIVLEKDMSWRMNNGVLEIKIRAAAS